MEYLVIYSFLVLFLSAIYVDGLHSEFDDINESDTPKKADSLFPKFRYTGPLGAKIWPSLYKVCGGENQSPIRITRRGSKPEKFEPFQFKNIDTIAATGTITNNGHTAMVTLPKGATLKGGDLPGEYEFLNFHFHWGSDSTRGSEHIIDGIQYPLELHMVFWNYNYFSMEEASHHDDGVAVLGVLFRVRPTNNSILEPIIRSLSDIKQSGSSKTFRPRFRLSDFLPQNRRSYYRYMGSFTTPQCLESVIWTVFTNTLPISERQVNEFRLLLNPENKEREDNFRPVQPLNSRIVRLNGEL